MATSDEKHEPGSEAKAEASQQAKAADQARAEEAGAEKAQGRTPVGGRVLAAGEIDINPGRRAVTLTVRNTGDRPIQVGSHFHFFEVNRALEFDRPAAFGMRLDIPATTAVRFEPGDEKQVTLVSFAGKQYVYGFNNLVDGWTGTEPTHEYRPNFTRAVRKAQENGFKSNK